MKKSGGPEQKGILRTAVHIHALVTDVVYIHVVIHVLSKTPYLFQYNPSIPLHLPVFTFTDQVSAQHSLERHHTSCGRSTFKLYISTCVAAVKLLYCYIALSPQAHCLIASAQHTQCTMPKLLWRSQSFQQGATSCSYMHGKAS